MNQTSSFVLAPNPQQAVLRRLRLYVEECRRCDSLTAYIRAQRRTVAVRETPRVREAIERAERLLRLTELRTVEVERALDSLSEPEARVIYGLVFDRMPIARMEKELDCTAEHIQCVRRRALKKLSAALLASCANPS